MLFFKDNKTLVTWWLVASVIAFAAFNKSNCDEVVAEPAVSDTLIYFSYSANQQQKLQHLFADLHHKYGFNGVVLIGQKDSVFYSESFGYSNYRNKDTLTENTAFQLASVSKQFTAVAILQLYQQKKLNLSDSIEHFYPDFPLKGITIHQMLTHRSGLPNYHYFLQHIPTTYDTLISNQQVVQEIISKNIPIYFSPNRRYLYSNTGYAVLAAIVEKVSGLRFDKYVETNIFKPLKMDQSFIYKGIENEKPTTAATGYLYWWREAEDNYLDGVMGDKGIYTSAADLFKWDQGLYHNQIIHRDTLELAFQPWGKPLHFKSNYGYGWRMFYWGQDSVKVLFHGGWWHGFKTLLLRIPQDSTTLIVLKNRSKGANISTRRLLHILYPDSLPPSDSLEIHVIEETQENEE
ncbi:MAG: serine hydrolase domain-containing protein [Salinivirgaceae bacterium]